MFLIMFHVVFANLNNCYAHYKLLLYLNHFFQKCMKILKFPCKADQVDSYNHSIPLLTFIHVITKMTSFETNMNFRIIFIFFSKKSMRKIVRYVMAAFKNDVYNQMSDYELQKLLLKCYSKDIYCEQVHK